jgi:hypothetical protein
MNKIAVYIISAWVASIICFCGLTYWLSHSKAIVKYTPDPKLKYQYDSLTSEAQKKEKQSRYLEHTIDSVLLFTASQQSIIDSLKKYKINKKISDEKTYMSVGSLPDSIVNAYLSDFLK